MSIYIFTGPTLSPEDARAELDAVYLPPVAQGDVYRVAQRRPEAIGIIDGYFERVPSVWHKEILWAMAQGIHVYGSASMGALRAAELGQFGMTGVGAIFEAFRDGELEDDDEVAVAHGAADTGYLAISEAMVNIRATLNRARAEGVLSPETAALLERVAKDLFYSDRALPLLIQRGADLGAPPAELAAFRAWLPGGYVNQKRLDAVAMLCRMRDDLAAAPGLKRVRYRFEHTIWWDHATRIAGSLVHDGDAAESVPLDLLLDELRLTGTRYYDAHQRTSLRYLALSEARRRNVAPTSELLRQMLAEFQQARGLQTPDDLRRWLEEHHISEGRLESLLRDEALVQLARNQIEAEIVARLPDHFRLSGSYRALIDRALDKQHTLTRLGLDNPSIEDAGITEQELVSWYLARQERAPSQWSTWHPRADGFDDEEAFRRAALREYCYVRALGQTGDPDMTTDHQHANVKVR